jgi:hypothetical protein
VPSQLTLVLEPLAGRTIASALIKRLNLLETQADPLQWAVTGFYVTPGGGNGRVEGELVGTLDEGTFTGTLTSESPECTAEREFGGSVDPQFLRWTGGSTLRDCKGSPLGFDSLVMIATQAPLPTTTAVSSSTTSAPVTCSYSLDANGVSVDAAGGQRALVLTTTPGCAWTVQNFVPWITVQPSNGSGAATISLTMMANAGAARSATVVVAGMPVVVNQAAANVPTTTTSTSTSSTTSTTSTTSTSSTTTTIIITGNTSPNGPAASTQAAPASR